MKRCLITCVTSEVGQEVALSLASKYDELFITGRDTSKLETIENNIKSLAEASVKKIRLDFLEKQSICDAIDEIQGKLDAVVLLLPKIPARSTNRTSDKEWEQLFRLTFTRPLLFLESLIPSLTQSKRAKVVLVSGITSKQYLGNYSVNGPLRAAWVAQMKAMAHEYGELGIHFNTLSFGGILTPSFNKKVENEAREKGIAIEEALSPRYANIPLRKYASIKDVCHSIEGMLSPMSDHITGQNIMCDGGFTRYY